MSSSSGGGGGGGAKALLARYNGDECPADVVEAFAKGDDKGLTSSIMECTDAGLWNWSQVDALSSWNSSASHSWLNWGTLVTSIYANLGEQWTKANRRNFRYRQGTSQPLEIVPASDHPKCPVTTFLLSWPDRIRSRDELRRFLLALLRPTDPEFLHLATYTAHQGWGSDRLVVTWPLLVEYWRRVYPNGVQVRPHQARLLTFDDDCRRIAQYWNLRHGIRECFPEVRYWLVDIVYRPRRHPFRPPHWAKPEFCTVLRAVIPDLLTFEPTSETMDQVEIHVARILAVCHCYRFLAQPPRRDQYSAVYRQYAVCIHKHFQTMAWFNHLHHH